VEHQGHAAFVGRRPEPIEAGVGERRAGDRGADLRADRAGGGRLGEQLGGGVRGL
jgi:hypothetical protein